MFKLFKWLEGAKHIKLEPAVVVATVPAFFSER
jgi:hypothetical protein